MALPVVFLREFQTNIISNWVPGKLVLTYEQLELLACETLSRSSKEWDVHFHFENGACEGKALPLFWDKGVYFDESCLKGWKLHLFAHFERSEAIPTGKQTHSTRDTGATKSHEDSISQLDKISPYGRNDIGLSILVLVDHYDQSVQLSATLNIPRKRRPSKVYNLSSSSESENAFFPREDGNKHDKDFMVNTYGGPHRKILPRPSYISEKPIADYMRENDDTPLGQSEHIRATNGAAKVFKDNIAQRRAMKRLSNQKQVFNYGKFRCPVQDCILPALDRYDNLTAHIRRMHPESIHAVVLEAASSRTPIVPPSPPPEEDFKADFLLASTINASEGQFGHRPKQFWDKALYNARTRIAHAKLIHGRYGAIVPKRCESCLKRGMACLAYHSRLKGYPHRAKSGRCGECRNRSTGCDLSSNPFDGLLLQDSDSQYTEQPADLGICNTEVMIDLMDFKMPELLDEDLDQLLNTMEYNPGITTEWMGIKVQEDEPDMFLEDICATPIDWADNLQAAIEWDPAQQAETGVNSQSTIPSPHDVEQGLPHD